MEEDMLKTLEKKEVIKLTSEIDLSIVSLDLEDSQQIHELRKRVFYVHTMIEGSLSIVIIDHFFNSILPEDYRPTEPDYTKWSILLGNSAEAFRDFKFFQLLTLANKLGALDKYGKGVYEMLTRFNKLRNILAHPRNAKISQFTDAKKYIEALRLTRDVAKFADNVDLKILEPNNIKTK